MDAVPVIVFIVAAVAIAATSVGAGILTVVARVHIVVFGFIEVVVELCSLRRAPRAVVAFILFDQLRMLLEPEIVAVFNHRYLGKVVVGRRGRYRPLERTRVPRVAPGPIVPAPTHEYVYHPYQDAERDQEPADGRRHVRAVPTLVGWIGVDAPGHAVHAQPVHREEREVEADQHQPEIEFS